jgi:hypothetical protein
MRVAVPAKVKNRPKAEAEGGSTGRLAMPAVLIRTELHHASRAGVYQAKRSFTPSAITAQQKHLHLLLIGRRLALTLNFIP